jgi:hypothetical protein
MEGRGNLELFASFRVPGSKRFSVSISKRQDTEMKHNILILVFVLLLSTSVASAQTVLLRGTVLDPSGAVIPEADLRLSQGGRVVGERKSDATAISLSTWLPGTTGSKLRLRTSVLMLRMSA